ncbi:MAG: hypothetical protein CMJ34_10590 [Phycisphaerae bacterium]|nr:hypothetical protein [Phycisphaerae bacterium]
MNNHESNDMIGGSVDSSIDDPVIRGGTIDFSVDDGFAGAVREDERRRLDGGTMVLIGVIIASVLGLWSMRFLGSTSGDTPPVQTMIDTQKWISEAEENGAPVPMGELAILASLDKDSLNALQVSLRDLRTRTPFRYHGEAVPVDGRDSESEPLIHTRPDEQIKDDFENTINGIGRKMRVTAILAPDTDRSQTILNGIRLTVGDVFEVPYEGREYTFEVERISRDGVVFVSRIFEPEHEYRIDIPLHRDY